MTTQSPVRVRFAPSPTGHLHIGGLRTALFNLLFAKHNKGTFLLRLEDTDLERSKDEYTQAILQALEWTNIASDEPMVIQSERLERHLEVIEQLLAKKRAYRCYCTPEELSVRLAAQQIDPEFVKYDGHCRSVLPQEGKSFVIRFALPDEQTITFNDLIRGEITFDKDQFDDFIIARSDGRPVYNFVVVVDDADMGITHVIRGEDHISNTPKQIMLHKACGFTPPQFAHLPLILGQSGQPLSKRDAATSALEYKQLGYLPDALVNYLARLGWSHGDQELFTREELINYFSLDHVGKKGAIFDMAKLGWVNSMYMKEMSDEAALAAIKDIRPRFEAELSRFNKAQLLALINLYKQRTKTLVELADEIKMVYDGSNPFLDDELAQWVNKDTVAHMKQIYKTLDELESFGLPQVTDAVKAIAKEHELKIVAVAQPLRIALIHKTAGPGVFELATILGKELTLSRIESFITYIQEHMPIAR